MSSPAMFTPANSSVIVQSWNVQPRFYSSVNVQSCNFSQPDEIKSLGVDHKATVHYYDNIKQQSLLNSAAKLQGQV